MLAVVCPSCNCKLNASSKLAGKTAKCPKCRSAVQVPDFEKSMSVGLVDTRTYRTVRVEPDGDTAEMQAFEPTAADIVLPPVIPAAEIESPTTVRRNGAL